VIHLILKGIFVFNISLFRAAIRLYPKMIVYHFKRAFRNWFCVRFPAAYSGYVHSVSKSVPTLSRESIEKTELASIVSRYYYDEYVDELDNASKGIFTFFGQRVDFGGPSNIDWHHEIPLERDLHLWRMKLAHMGFVCPMLISGTDNNLRAVEVIVSGYYNYARFDLRGCFSSYWFPYSVSHRILAILSGYVLARSNDRLSESLAVQIEDFLRWNVGFLLLNIEHELKNNHVERNLAAICLYYGYANTISSKLARKIDKDVHDLITSCILTDGMLSERSTMYHIRSNGIFVG
jgi:hypothetical protein